MTHSGSRRSDLLVPIEQHFTLESRIAYSLQGQVFKAVDRNAHAGVALWISRKSLSEEETDRFLQRAERIVSVGAQPEVIAFGLDPMRQGWVSFRLLSGRRVLEGRVESLEAERRWLGCVRAVERFHKAGLACGDICQDTFILTASGDVRFFGGLGVLSSPSELLAAMPADEAEELRLYVAPEQLDQPSDLLSSDVFGLARLAYRFFCKKPLAQSVKEKSSSGAERHAAGDRVPPWFDGVILPLLVCRPEDRPQDASALLQTLLRERTEVTVKAQASQSRGSSPAKSGSAVVKLPTRTPRARWLVPAAVSAAIVMGLVLGLGVLRPGGRGKTGLARFAPSWLFGLQVSQQELQDLAASDDPMTNEVLVRMAADARDSGDRRTIIEALLGRSRRLGLPRSSELVRGWVAQGSSTALVAGDAPLALKAINPVMPESARQDVAMKAMQADSAAGAQLAAALALDLQQKELFRRVFELAAKGQGRIQDADGRSTSALMAAITPIRALYVHDLLADAALTPSDTVWLLARLGEQEEPNVKPVVAIGLQNGAFKGTQRVFAEALTSSGVLSSRERAVFVSCLVGVPTKANAIALTSSYNPDAPRALFAILWRSNDPAVREAAMDGLFAKPLGDPSLQIIAEYLKAKKPGERDRYARVFAAAGLTALLTDDEFSSGFAVLRDGSSEPELIPILLQRAPPRVVFEVLDASGNKLRAPEYLDLLKHPSKEVRLEALKRLRNFNDATMFALVRQMYEDERDGDVRREYEAFLSS